MDLIQRCRSLIAVLYERAQLRLRASELVTYSIAFLLSLNAGNAFCKDSRDNWDRISGPIPIVNQAPIQLLFLQPIPDRAEPYPESRYSLSLNTAITNTLQWGRSENYYGYMDMEMVRTCLEVKYGIFSGVEIGMSVPFVYSYGGFMDHGILEFEKLFNVVRNLREKEDHYGRADTYTYSIKKNDKAFIEGKEGSSGLGDFALRVKGRIWDEGSRRPCLSGRFCVKIPTGDEDRAFGSGEVDYGLGLLLQKTIRRATAYLNADVIFPGHAFEQEDVSLRTFCEMMLGGEYKFSERFSGLMQLYYITRPFEDTGLEMLDRRMWNLLLGVSYLTKTGVCIQGGLVEDFFTSSNTGADITFFLNIGKNF
jgi:hypothetical protein